MGPAENLLSRLEKVTPKGKGQWAALCPAHDDKNPSMSIKETDDGTILVKCWSGCGALAIVQAVGLELKNLFPVNEKSYRPRGQYRDRLTVNYRELLKRLSVDLTVIVIAVGDVIAERPIAATDMQRVIEAEQRLRKIMGAANV